MALVIFLSMNETASKRSRRKTSKSKRPQVASSLKVARNTIPKKNGSPSEDNCQRRRLAGLEDLCIQGLATNWDQQAECAFFHDYVFPDLGDGRGGYLEFLGDLCSEQPDTPYLVSTIAAVSMANFANRTGTSSLGVRAQKSYGRALYTINEALNDSVEARSDCLLTSLFLLNIYEQINGDIGKTSEHHTRGQMELIRLRGQDQFRTRRGCDLYGLIRSRQRLEDLVLHRCPTKSLNTAFKCFAPGPHAAKLAELLSRVTQLLSSVTIMPEPGAQHDEWVLSAIKLLECMKSWNDESRKMRIYWLLSVQAYSAVSEFGKTPQYPKSIFVFKNVRIAVGYTIFWCARIILLQAMLKYQRNLPTVDCRLSPLPSEYSIRKSLFDGVNNICAATPFLLEEIDSRGALNPESRRKALGAYYLTWALHVAGSVECIPSAQAAWISERLLCIGNVFGIKQALVLRDDQRAAVAR